MKKTTVRSSMSFSFPELTFREATMKAAASRFGLPFLALAAGLMLSMSGRADEPPIVHFRGHDRIAYVRPYATALRQARTEERILIVRPFPVGGVMDGSRDGRWCPLADYMRAVTLSDETVVSLISRRFVFTYFSLVDWAELSDAEAKRAIVKIAPEYGEKVRQTPPTFFLSPDANVLATLDTTASPDAFLRLAKTLLAEHPEYNRPSAEETELRKNAQQDPRSRLLLARLQLELAQPEQAKETLENLTEAAERIEDSLRADAFYLLGQRARVEGDAKLADQYFSRIDALPREARESLAIDLRMERAHLLAAQGDWEGSLNAWSAIEAEVPFFDRKAELLYSKGLSYYHLGKRREANYTWVRVMKELPEGRFYQKARLAAMGPSYSPPSPDLLLPGTNPTVRYFSNRTDPNQLPGSDLGYGTSSSGRMGTEETPERFLTGAYRDYDEVQRQLASAPAEHR